MTGAPRPYTLIAELTYRCPLGCAYCSNPLELAQAANELSTEDWARVFAEAAALGILQLNLTGGEPLVRGDLEALVGAARARDLYVNLITSGIPADADRLRRLAAAGLDSLQLSVQDVDPEGAAWIAGRADAEAKLATAAAVREIGLPLTLNVVLHRGNIARVPELVELAERLGAIRLELANTQSLGWALVNRDALLPSAGEIERARQDAAAARERLRGRMEILFVRPDYHAERPRACMDGWARRYLLVAPDGVALPCHQARSIKTLTWENVRDRPLAAIWEDGPGFQAFRGEAWMPEPCRSCDERAADFGGCRCQAFALLGDAAATDPACALSPHHDLVVQARSRAQTAVHHAPLRLRRFRPAS
ncbi:MAG TPA: pyrroloquinoline quinone biosynthesis protein PqqE [Polyangia bacterium]|nr:pyrroloquinoline quinone biosynthesis protein PqqE [Polyangia bacterium]